MEDPVWWGNVVPIGPFFPPKRSSLNALRGAAWPRRRVMLQEDEMLLQVPRLFLEEKERKLRQIKFIPNHLRDA